MDWNAGTRQFLNQLFSDTLSPQSEVRSQAESYLLKAADTPNYGLVVLELVADSSIEEQTRQLAAVNFKNHLKSRWSPAPPSEANPISPEEKKAIKSRLVNFMCLASPRIQSQLTEALSIIGEHDSNRDSPEFLPWVGSRLSDSSQSNDYATVNGHLATVDSFFKKFQHQFKSNDLLKDLKYCLDNFAKPLLEVFKRTANLIDQLVASGAANAATLEPFIESQKLCCRIFYSMNYQELPEFFEVHMTEWMDEFKKYLTVKYPDLEDDSSDDLALVDELRAAICENISLYMVKEEELFKVHVNEFVDAVRGLLHDSSASHGREQLIVNAIKFLTTVSTSVHNTLLLKDALQQICESIVIPNVMLRDKDEELFKMNPVEFIRRDMQGSDIDTRRRIACELLKGIATYYKDEVAEKVITQINNCLALFTENPNSNWKYKDCAIYLVVSLATKSAGGNSVSTDLLNVQNFFASQIVPELQSQDVTSFPMLKAGALKFFTLFRNQILKSDVLQVLTDIIHLLSSTDYVVHSYAANCIEKLLLLKDDGARARYTSADIGPFLLPLMKNLFCALNNPKSEENQYVMKCIMRVVGVADLTPHVAFDCIVGLTTVLEKVCQNPKNSLFNHYLFESVAAVIKRACEKGSSLVPRFEEKLLPCLQRILIADINEFPPYALQLLAQLVDLNMPPLQKLYMDLFNILLSPATWTTPANIPALVRLLQALLPKVSFELYQLGEVSKVIGIFEMLVPASSTENQGFYILNTVFENLGHEVISPYLKNIWNFLFNQLQDNKRVKFLKNFIVSMSLFLVKYGCQSLVSSTDAVTFTSILENFWIPNLKLIKGSTELKLTSIALTRLICESPRISDAKLWGKVLDSNVTLLSRPEQARLNDEPEFADFGETVECNTTFGCLYNARKEEDPLREIKDPKRFLVESLSKFSASLPAGVCCKVINENLEQANQAALLQLCNLYNVTLR